MASEPPAFDDVLRRAFERVGDDDARLFYRYFEEMKAHVRSFLHRKARDMPGESAVAQSALFSLFCDLVLAEVPLSDVDEEGYPTLWPLLLEYLERHCNKWNKWYRAAKRKGTEVSLEDFDVADYRGPADDENAVHAALDVLQAKVTARQMRVAELSARGLTLAEIARELGCSESLVSREKKIVRTVLMTS